VQRVFIAFDRDEAGDKGADESPRNSPRRRRLLPRFVSPRPDANGYALNVTPADKSLGLVLRSALPIGEQAVPAPILRGVVAARLRMCRAAPSSLAAKAASEAVLLCVRPSRIAAQRGG